MEKALIRVGLPVKCAWGDCKAKACIKPGSDYGGWYKSKFFIRRPRKRWFCPEHYEQGRGLDNRYFKNFDVPDPYTDAEQELYKLLEE